MGAGTYRSVAGGLVHATADVIDDVLSMGAAAVGMVVEGSGNLAAGVAIREGMPIFLALLLMVFVAVRPFLMVFSRYDVSALVTLTLVFFGLQFFYVLWGNGVLGRQSSVRGTDRGGVGSRGQPGAGACERVGAARALHRDPARVAGGHAAVGGGKAAAPRGRRR